MKWFFGAVLLAVIGLACFLCGTTAGARVLSVPILSQYRGSGPAVIGRFDGTLWRGVVLHEIAIRGPAEQPPDATFQAARMDIPSLWDALAARDVRFVMYGVHLSRVRFAEDITVDRLDGTLSGWRRLSDLRLRDVKGLPEGSGLEIQQLDAVRPIELHHIHLVHNARLRMPSSEPVVFSATQRRGRWDLRAYCKAVSVQELLEAAGPYRPRGTAAGTLSEVYLTATGAPRALELTGEFTVDQLSRGAFSLARAPGTLRLSLTGLPGTPQVTGAVELLRGTGTAKQTTINLRRSALRFTGEWLSPAFDVSGSSIVEGVAINLALTGTKDAPVLRLSSDPPAPQGVLLIMLATGKRWQGPQEVWADEQVSSELATDFIDYFVFGGLGSRIGRRFGITDLAITHGTQTNWVGVETTIADRVTLGLQVDPTPIPHGPVPAPGQPRLLPSRVGAEVKLTDTTAVDIIGERTPLTRPASSTTDSSTTGPETEDAVFLKLKKRF